MYLHTFRLSLANVNEHLQFCTQLKCTRRNKSFGILEFSHNNFQDVLLSLAVYKIQQCNDVFNAFDAKERLSSELNEKKRKTVGIIITR